MFRPSAHDPALSDLLHRLRNPAVHSFDERREPRQACNRVAALNSEGLSTPIGCVIEDLSPSGCRLRLTARALFAPDDMVSLFIPCCRLVLTGRAVWQKGDEIGVMLDADQDLGRPQPDSWTTDVAVNAPSSGCRGVSSGSGGRASCAASSRAGWCRTR